MMAVLIENTEMPRDCYECEFEHFGRCQLCSKPVPRIGECPERAEFCPLREPEPADRWVPVTDSDDGWEPLIQILKD